MPDRAIDHLTAEKVLPHFLFTEEAFLRVSAEMTRNECCVYLLILSGYAPKARGSRYGAKGAREQLTLSKPGFRLARDGLEARGLIRVVGKDTKRPHTTIASLARPFKALDREVEDGHKYDQLSDEGDLILLPMSLIYGDNSVPEARLESLQCRSSVRVLLWCYLRTDSEGGLRSDWLWIDADSGLLRMAPRFSGVYGLDATEVAEAGIELIDSDLLMTTGEVDNRGRVAVRLRLLVQEQLQVSMATQSVEPPVVSQGGPLELACRDIGDMKRRMASAETAGDADTAKALFAEIMGLNTMRARLLTNAEDAVGEVGS